MGRIGRAVTLLGVAAISSCTTRLWIWNATWTITPVPLTAGLPSETLAKSLAFDQRIKARFPLGTPMAEAGLELAREKFVRLDWSPSKIGEHFAKRNEGGAPVCNSEAWVYWKADEADRLTEIRGEYQVICL